MTDDQLAQAEELANLLELYRSWRTGDGDLSYAPHAAATTITALIAENRRLVEVITRAADFLRDAPLVSGCCCCGNPMEGHGYYDGHSPVDEGAYRSMQMEEELRAALGPKP